MIKYLLKKLLNNFVILIYDKNDKMMKMKMKTLNDFIMLKNHIFNTKKMC